MPKPLHPDVIASNALLLRGVIATWERYGACHMIEHCLACAIARRELGPRFPILPTEDLNYLLIAFGIVAAMLGSESNGWSSPK